MITVAEAALRGAGAWVAFAVAALLAVLAAGVLAVLRRRRAGSWLQPANPGALALQHSEERYRTVVESARDYAIFTTDLQGKVVDWYAGAQAVFGWSAEEMRGRSADILFVPADRDRAVPERERAVAALDGEAPDIRWHLRKDGRRVFIEGKVVPFGGSDQGSKGFLKIGQDVTARRRAEQRLHQSEERFSRFAGASSDVLWIRDATSLRFEYVSPAFADIYAVPVEDVMAGNTLRRWLQRVHRDDRRTALGGIRSVRLGQRVLYEYRVVRPDGEVRWIRDTGFPLLDDAGHVTSVAGIAADATDERIASDRRQVLMNELQHRTRNLIAVVQALADSTQRESRSPDEFMERFRSRLGAMSRVQGMLARLDEGERIAFDVLLEAELAAHGMSADSPRVVLRGPRGIALKSRNVQTFALALHELATNAVKHGAFATAQGRLAVRWWLEAEGTRLHVDWRESGVDTRAVADRGPQPAAGLSGYGRELIERALPYQMDARTSYRIEPDGVHCTIVLSLFGR